VLISLASPSVAKLTHYATPTEDVHKEYNGYLSERGQLFMDGRNICPHCGGTGIIESDADGSYVQCASCAATFWYRPDGNPQISVHGANAAEVEQVAHSLFSKAPATRAAQKRFPLVSAVFFLILFIVVFGAILTAARLLPTYVFPLVLIGAILTFSVVGAFILREDASLSEKSFLDLMRLSFRYLPLLRKREK
jgi:hypothetical protein